MTDVVEDGLDPGADAGFLDRNLGAFAVAQLIVDPPDVVGLLVDENSAPRIARRIEEGASLGGVVVLHSDGLKTRWHLDDYPGLAQRHPALIAGMLFRDHRRPHDDCSVVVAK